MRLARNDVSTNSMVFLIQMVTALMLSMDSQAQVVTYRLSINPSESSVRTSTGDLTVAGDFRASIRGNRIEFSNISILTEPADFASEIVPKYVGIVTPEGRFRGSASYWRPYSDFFESKQYFSGNVEDSSFRMIGTLDNSRDPSRDHFTLRGEASLMGDFDQDGALTAADIDLLGIAVQTGKNGPRFDVTGDERVDWTDREVWINELAFTYDYHTNLDGEFNSSDFVTAFQAGEYEDAFDQNSGWAEGDRNGDGESDSRDFVGFSWPIAYEAGPRPMPPIIGDLNGDGVANATDIDVLSNCQRTPGCQDFDLDGSGRVDGFDRERLLEDLLTGHFDSNLDGQVTTSDFVQAFQSGKYEKDADATWEDGDWNGDGRFNSSDFVMAFAAGVPEPESIIPFLLGLLAVTRCLRQRRT